MRIAEVLEQWQHSDWAGPFLGIISALIRRADLHRDCESRFTRPCTQHRDLSNHCIHAFTPNYYWAVPFVALRAMFRKRSPMAPNDPKIASKDRTKAAQVVVRDVVLLWIARNEGPPREADGPGILQLIQRGRGVAARQRLIE